MKKCNKCENEYCANCGKKGSDSAVCPACGKRDTHPI